MPLQAIRSVAACAAGIVIAGCSGGGQSASADALRARERASIAAVYGAVKADARRLTYMSAEYELVAARDRADQLRKRIATLPKLEAQDQAEIRALETEAKRLDAALRVLQARKKLEQLSADARLSPAQKRKGAEERRAILRMEWPEFRRADDALMAAERAYAEATKDMALDLQREQGVRG